MTFIPRLLGLVCLLSIGLPWGSPQAYELERRREQFGRTPGYLIVPAPYRYPGIGQGIVFIGYAGNVLESTVDSYLLLLTGDSSGAILNVDEAFLYPEHLYLRYFHIDIRKFGINFYEKRGIATEKEDFRVAVGDKFLSKEPSLTLTFWDRRLDLSYGWVSQEGRITELRSPEGELLSSATQEIQTESFKTGLQVDLTDDRADPRSGMRLKLLNNRFVAKETTSPDYTVQTVNFSTYVPMLEDSTWAFNYFQSSAFVSRTGLTDLNLLKISRGFNSCVNYGPGQAACEASVTSDAVNQQLQNKNGTAEHLGGPNRLRSYPDMRYQGAHSVMYGTEFRWNLQTGDELLDWLFLSDIQEALQVAFFFEQGSVAESRADLGALWRSSYGLGGRLVTGSGAVYRLDLASGNEGSELTVLFQYPWE